MYTHVPCVDQSVYRRVVALHSVSTHPPQEHNTNNHKNHTTITTLIVAHDESTGNSTRHAAHTSTREYHAVPPIMFSPSAHDHVLVRPLPSLPHLPQRSHNTCLNKRRVDSPQLSTDQLSNVLNTPPPKTLSKISAPSKGVKSPPPVSAVSGSLPV